jgi:hypothetical protein
MTILTIRYNMWVTATVIFFKVLGAVNIQEITSKTGSEISYNLYKESEIVHSSPWESMASQFGMHKFSGSLTGRLVILKGDNYLCKIDKAEDVTEEAKTWITPPEQLSGFGNIMLVQRGKPDGYEGVCAFVDKVHAAEVLGAKAVIVWDDREEALFTMWDTDDIFGSPINIPSVLVSYSHGLELMGNLTAGKWNKDSTTDNIETLEPMTVTLRWGLPHPDGTVELDYYTCADDFKSLSFKENFPEVIPALNNTLTFTPHYFILDGTRAGCRGWGQYCGNQCANDGRYCVQDPDLDYKNGLSGFDVLEEDLRQICVWKYQKQQEEKGSEDQEEETQHWFKYVDLFNKNCLGNIKTRKVDEKKFHTNCSETQMDTVDKNMWQYVQSCVEESGGLAIDLDKENPLFEAELKMQKQHDIFSCPQAVVNNFRLNNNWDCPSSVSISTCETFESVCAGYAYGSTPEVCGGSPGCPAGEYIDECQMCLKKSDPKWNKMCLDCEGKINGPSVNSKCSFGTTVCAVPGVATTKACTDLCKWDAFDACGVCKDPKLPDFKSKDQYPNAVFDCAGVCDGSAINDCDGVCGGKKITYCGECIANDDSRVGLSCDKFKSCKTLVFDACGECVLDPKTDDYLKPSEHPGAKLDCMGVCGGSMVSHCDQCLEPTNHLIGFSCNKISSCTSGIFDACSDCVEHGAPFVNPDEHPNAVKDCAGVCTGTKVTYCGLCIEREDPRIGKECSSITGDIAGPQSSSSSSNSTQLALIVSLVCFVVIIVALIVYYMWKRMNRQETEFKRLMSQYTLLDETQREETNA